MVTFGNEVAKILCNLCLHFAREYGQDGKANHATKVTKIPKTKRRKYGMNETKYAFSIPISKQIIHNHMFSAYIYAKVSNFATSDVAIMALIMADHQFQIVTAVCQFFT